jgi:hypothetical protein
MDDALLVRVREPRQHLSHDVERARHFEPPLLDEDLVEAAPAHELHDDEGLVPVQPEVDDGDAMRVLQACHHLGLAFEALLALHLVAQRRVHDLDRDGAVEVEADRAIDDAHRAIGDPLDDLVPAIDHLATEIAHATNLSARDVGC